MVERAAAGWHPDPSGRFELRFWDGHAWTQHISTAGRQGWDSAPGPTTLTATPLHFAAGWYSDPNGHGWSRYWDGRQWTSYTSPSGGAAVPSSATPAAPVTTPRTDNKVARQARVAGAVADLAGDGTLFTEQVLVVNQKAKVLGSKVEYAIYDQHGRRLGAVHEGRRGYSRGIRVNLGGPPDERPIRNFRVADTTGRVLLEMTRSPAGWFTSKGKLAVRGPGGAPIGQIVLESTGLGGSVLTLAHDAVQSATVVTRFGLGGVTGWVAGKAVGKVQPRLDSAVEGLDEVGHARFGLEADGRRLGSIHAESTTEWDFNVQDPTGTEIARVTKTWAGWAKERFTKADNYVVKMHRPLEEPLRSLVIAAALAIDVELKERGDQTWGSSVGGTRHYR